MRYVVEREGSLILIRVPDGATDATLDGESLYEQIEPMLGDRSGAPYGVLHDLRRTPRSPIRRKRFTDWVSAHGALIKSRVSGYATVSGSSLQQGMITAVLWVIEPPVRWRSFTDPDLARRWLLAPGD